MLNVRNATVADLDQIMKIYRHAQDHMARTGNPTQWGRSYPDVALIRSDISQSACKVLYDEDGIHGAFALFSGAEPTYAHIEDGAWPNDAPYLTIHRLAGDGQVHGLFPCVLRYCQRSAQNIRVDTHADNRIMQRLIERSGFTRCGIIHVKNGTPRIAYQWTAE